MIPARVWARWLPSLVLIGVALHQIFLVQHTQLSPWLGGGFGMFSTTDVGSARHLHAFVQRPGIDRLVSLPPRLEDAERRTLALPSESNLRGLALALADEPTPDHGAAEAVRIQVWRTHFDPATLAPESQILRELELTLDAE
jgi:hypothetical protein